MPEIPLLKESLTITHLRKLHRQGASVVAMARVAGSAEHFKYLDGRYGITQPAAADDTPWPTGMSGAEAIGTRHYKRFPVPKFIPPELYMLVTRVSTAFDLEDGLLVSKRSYSHLMQPRSAFSGIAITLWPALDFPTIGHVLNREPRMIHSYIRNHDQFYGSPDYTLKVERIIAAMGAVPAVPAKEVAAQ